TRAIQEVGYGTIYSPISAQIFCSPDHNERTFFTEWQDQIVGPHRRLNSLGGNPDASFDAGYYRDYIDTVTINQFDETGTRRLETITTVNRGRRLAIFARFMNDEIEHARWLGAPVIEQTIKDGRLSFTPDATREETQQLIDGLNAAAEEIKKPYVF
ncbi:MAG: hypothetical protein EBU26_16355, partial [Verrucomicrobia bacterium]|nr:hypothetical protein [Verrucomicrobiota bacterium]